MPPFEHRYVEIAAEPGALAPADAGQHADAGKQGRHLIGQRQSHFRGRPAGLAGDRQGAGHRLDHEVIGRLVPPRAGLAETRDAAIDQTGIDCREARIIEPQPLCDAMAEVLDDDIRLAHQVDGDAPSRIGLQVDRDAFLIAVERQEVMALAVDERMVVPGGVGAFEVFDPDDVSAEVAENHGGQRSRKHPREIHHPHPVERCRAPACPWVLFSLGHVASPSILATIIPTSVNQRHQIPARSAIRDWPESLRPLPSARRPVSPDQRTSEPG